MSIAVEVGLVAAVEFFPAFGGFAGVFGGPEGRDTSADGAVFGGLHLFFGGGEGGEEEDGRDGDCTLHDAMKCTVR